MIQTSATTYYFSRQGKPSVEVDTAQGLRARCLQQELPAERIYFADWPGKGVKNGAQIPIEQARLLLVQARDHGYFVISEEPSGKITSCFCGTWERSFSLGKGIVRLWVGWGETIVGQIENPDISEHPLAIGEKHLFFRRAEVSTSPSPLGGAYRLSQIGRTLAAKIEALLNVEDRAESQMAPGSKTKIYFKFKTK